jgi:hypothetical protein
MKSKILILLGVVTLLTLSFTLVSIHSSEPVQESQAEVVPATTVNSEPAGGFVSEDRY